ncbi:uncharacterized protein LOC135484921 isoform X2 [Lineus longissimus]|uniref:uncharacterized protein LOC135484921 isoform X2 n=1 Tax=Lineus longissimus TaxID=88925 RepID=UPI00315C57E8
METRHKQRSSRWALSSVFGAKRQQKRTEEEVDHPSSCVSTSTLGSTSNVTDASHDSKCSSPAKRFRTSAYSPSFSPSKSPAQLTANRLLLKALKPSPSKIQARGIHGEWSHDETVALVQFIAMHRELQTNEETEWPMMKPPHNYWTEAAKYIHDVTESVKRQAGGIRSKVIKLRNEYGTVDNAEERLGITVDSYVDGTRPAPTATPPQLSLPPPLKDLGHLTPLQKQQLSENLVKSLPESQLLKLLKSQISINTFSHHFLSDLIQTCFRADNMGDHTSVLDELFFCHFSKQADIGDLPGADFITLSVDAMKKLKSVGKSNLIYKWPRCISLRRPKSEESLLPLNRMPFGLIEYQIDFFNANHVNQVKESKDFASWRETLDAELTLHQDKLITGPMWSGLPHKDLGNPLKSRVNLACRSKQTVRRKLAKVEGVSTEPEIQKNTILQLKDANPDGRFWLKADGVDVKPALQESMKGTWNGDTDIGDGKLQKLREDYDNRRRGIEDIISNDSLQLLHSVKTSLEDDSEFLNTGVENAIKIYRSKFNNKNTPEETLKSLHWEVVEYTTLLTQSQQFIGNVEKILEQYASNTMTIGAARDCLRKMNAADYKTYLKNLFKKKRQPPASHVLVFMLSDERRKKKPYAAPVQFIPYHSIRDQYIRDFSKAIKQEMVSSGLCVVGTVTDGEFCSLRSMGETRPLHLWQLVHDAKQAVSRMNKQTLLEVLIPTNVFHDGVPVMIRENEVVPDTLKLQLHDLVHQQRIPEEEAIDQVRQELVPVGYEPCPWRPNCPESYLEKLRSILGTMYFRNSVESWSNRGVDFRHHLYIPEVDPTTNQVHHERADHCHLLKRIAGHTREGRYPMLEFDGFDEAMRDPGTGLTYAALVGKRKQSVTDAEKLLSFPVAKFLEENGFESAAKYVHTIAQWHEGSDGRGLSQLQRSRYNYLTLNYIMDELMPWHAERNDLSTIDINRPWNSVRGFSRETLIEVTTNIESQEYRRRENTTIGYSEHPRAGTTDDVEALFSICHRHLGDTFTLQDFKHRWMKLVNEFNKRMDHNLPFYYWTLNERFKLEQESFDQRPDFDENEVDVTRHPLRLHRLRLSSREDSSIFSAGRSFLPAKNRPSVRQRFHRLEVGLPPVPEDQQIRLQDLE